ncbi:MAG: NACHT domain-containing protein, partial [Synechococcales bacterium]|nr:NACHT domain-containing protein [Synechococcales bacterium]
MTDAVIKLIVAGSGGYALYNLYVEDLPKAAIATLISATAGFANRSWQTLLTPVGEWWNARLGRTGATLKQQVESLDQRVSGVPKVYLEALKAYCQDLEIEGYKGYLSALPLKEVYVPLKINADIGDALKLGEPRTIWYFLPRANGSEPDSPSRRLVITADPGFGKTTLTRYLTLSFADQSYKAQNVKALFPVLLLLRSVYSQIQDEVTPSLSELMVQQIKRLPRCQDLPPFDQWLQTQLQQGDLLVMFDGLDEVPDEQREKVSRWINWQMQAYTSQFILTSRPHGYDPTLFRGVRQVKIAPFTNPDKAAFIQQWYQTTLWIHKWKPLYDESQRKPEAERLLLEQVEAQSQAEATEQIDDLNQQLFKNADLTKLAENPLLITIIATVHQSFKSLPKYRKDLYKRIFDLLLEYRPQRRETRLTIPTAEDNQKILQTLALELVQRNETQFTPEQGAEWIAERLTQLRPNESLTPEKYLQEIEQVSGVLAG